MTTTTSLGNALVDRLMAQDWDGAGALLSPTVEFRGLTPKKVFELDNRDDVISQYRRWFEAGTLDRMDGFEDGAIEQRLRMRYRVYWTNAESEPYSFEQTVYYEADEGGITWIELMCSGHIPS